MLRKGLACLPAVYIAACAPSFADDLPMRPAAICPPAVHARHSGGAHVIRRHYARAAGIAYVSPPYEPQIRVDGCWQYQPVYDRMGDFYGRQLVKVCIDLPPN